jgi:drug/metabolite transporter (DMT)-like permease
MKIDWARKLTSRKLWVAIAGFVTGVTVLVSAGATEETITGCIMALGSVVAYIVGEGLTDAAATGTSKTQTKTKTKSK